MTRIYGIWVSALTLTGPNATPDTKASWQTFDGQLFRTQNIGVARAQVRMLRKRPGDFKYTVEIVGKDGWPQDTTVPSASHRPETGVEINHVAHYKSGIWDAIAEDKHGKEFLREVRAIVRGCSAQETPAGAARHTASFLLAMLDEFGEYSGGQYKIVTWAGEPVKFCHHDL